MAPKRKSAKRRSRKSAKKGSRKSVRKSARKSVRKSAKRGKKARKSVRKSAKRGKKSVRKSSRKSKKVAKRGCVAQSTAKYTSRPSPPYPANECRVGMSLKGNDGNIWKIRKASNGVNRWVKV